MRVVKYFLAIVDERTADASVMVEKGFGGTDYRPKLHGASEAPVAWQN
jgi:hypothetical protein